MIKKANEGLTNRRERSKNRQFPSEVERNV